MQLFHQIFPSLFLPLCTAYSLQNFNLELICNSVILQEQRSLFLKKNICIYVIFLHTEKIQLEQIRQAQQLKQAEQLKGRGQIHGYVDFQSGNISSYCFKTYSQRSILKSNNLKTIHMAILDWFTRFHAQYTAQYLHKRDTNSDINARIHTCLNVYLDSLSCIYDLRFLNTHHRA